GGLDEAWADRVDAHAFRRQAGGKRAGHCNDPALRCRIAIDSRLTDERIGGGGQYDRSRSLPEHLLADIFAAVERAVEDEVDDLVPGLFRQLGGAPVLA